MALTRLPSFTLLGTDSYTFGNANVSGNVTAGNLKTDHLLYANGTPYVFTTNAAGLNTQVQFNDGNSFTGSANFTFDKTSNTLTVTNYAGNGSGLSSLTAANITGIVGNATHANIADVANSVAGANVTGIVGNATHSNIADVANSVAVANVTGIGNIATINKDGNASNILYGNGVFAGAPITYANSNVTAYLPTYTGNLSPGNLTVSGKTVLSNVGNVTITGGLSNQLLQTDGLGNLSWVTPTGTTLTVDNFTGNGVQTAFTLSITPASKVYTMLAIAGVMQPRSVYSLTGNVITFSSAPPNTAPIEVTTFSSVMGYGTTDIVANTFTANTLTANTLSGNIISSNSNLTVNTLSANSVTNTGTGIPTINSATSINFTASTVVRTTSSPFQFYNCTTTVRDAIAASNGYVIYNTTTNKLQVYANGTWVDLH
jgi:hypothetical protein